MRTRRSLREEMAIRLLCPYVFPFEPSTAARAISCTLEIERSTRLCTLVGIGGFYGIETR